MLLALPRLPVPACQPRMIQGRVWMTRSSATKAWTHFSTPGLFQRRMNTSGSGWATPVEWTMTPLGVMVRPAR